MNFDPAVIASILVGMVAAASAYASQRAASRASTLNINATTRVDMEKEAYQRARKLDVETIDRQDTELDDLRKENEELQVKIRALIQHIIQLEQAKGYYPNYPPKTIEGAPE
jgi:TolA-binding protein